MKLSFLRERLSWLLLLAGLQLLLFFVAFVDASIPLGPVLYIIMLNTLLCVLFLFYRYARETRFYRNLKSRDDVYHAAQDAGSPFELIVQEAVFDQTERYRREAEENRLLLEAEKDDLLGWVHEVKTPLTALQLMIERLPDEGLQSRMTYEWLRVHHLLDQQLHRKRIPFMRNDLFIETVRLEPVINREIRELRSWCMAKGIGFDIGLVEEEVLTDAKWLGFILRQLLTNAVKYSGPSDIVIESAERNGHVTMTLADSGRGIAARDVPRIFEPGFTSTGGRQEGDSTGMGLYLAKQAADNLQIGLKVKSAPGQGTAFTLTFPRNNDFVGLTGM